LLYAPVLIHTIDNIKGDEGLLKASNKKDELGH
jgi:hypothetical protein